MRRVSEEELRTQLWVQITVLKPALKRAIGAVSGIERKAVVDRLMERVFNGVVVLAPSPVDSRRRSSSG